MCVAAELPCVGSVSPAVSPNQYFLLLGEVDLPQQTQQILKKQLCCFFNIILLLKIRGQILLPNSTVSETHRNGNDFHLSVTMFFETGACSWFAANLSKNCIFL